MKLIYDSENKKFVLPVEGHEAFITFEIEDGHMSLTHTEVPAALRGKGVGKKLVTNVFEYIKENNIKATAVCGYIKAFKRKNPKWDKYVN